VEDRIEALDKQVAVLRKLRDSVHRPEGMTPGAGSLEWQAQT
jgi:hypothetical protein